MYTQPAHQLPTTKVTELSNQYVTPKDQDQASDFQGVTLKMNKKKSRGSEHTQGVTSVCEILCFRSIVRARCFPAISVN